MALFRAQSAGDVASRYGDEELRREVESLLAHESSTEGFLDAPRSTWRLE
jgi:hypothetical protein